MHKYFRAIGFSENMKALDIYNLMESVMTKATHRAFITDPQDDNAMLTELRLDLGSGYGVCVTGVYDEDEEFDREAIFPYFASETVSSLEQVVIEERIEGRSYAGIVDDLAVGTSLIFRLLNEVAFLKSGAPQYQLLPGTSVCLSGLSVEGSVMLPIQKTREDVISSRKSDDMRRSLMTRAREGDEEAMRDLTMQDMEMYNVIMDKLVSDDIYTIVESTFMPTGVECDLYSVLGEIVSCELTRNPITMEHVWILAVAYGDLRLKICINDADLYGEPAPGRRFKGLVWLQGIVNFPDMVEEIEIDP